MKILLYSLVPLLIGALEVAGIYYLTLWSPFLGALLLGLSFFGWRFFTPHSFNSDAAGNAMASGFQFIFDVVASVVITIIFYIAMKSSIHDSILQFSLTILSLYAFIASFMIADGILTNEKQMSERIKEQEKKCKK